MGELVTAADSLAMGTVKGAKLAGHATKEETRKSSTGCCKRTWNCIKDEQCKKSRFKCLKRPWSKRRSAENGRCKGNVCRSLNRFERQSPQCAGNNFLHGGGKAVPGGGTQAHQRSGQNTSRELGPEDSRTLNNTSNPTFQGATKFDTATQSNVNMTRKEFYDEKRDQGKNIGNTVALNMMIAAEKKEQAMKKNTSLGDKLTDGVRASE